MIATVVVHGVGLWPGSLREVADVVASRSGGPVEIWTRPPYRAGASPDSLPLAAQVRALAGDLVGRGPTRVVGVSGGATLALALAIESAAGRLDDEVADTLVGIVTHEPLVGVLEPTLDARVVEAGRRLAEAPSSEAALAFLAGLYGPSWELLGAEALAWAEAHVATICAEVAEFAAFQPTEAELQSISVPHVTSVGARSAPERHRVAHLLAGAGARSVVVPDCGHLLPVDAPARMADLAAPSRNR